MNEDRREQDEENDWAAKFTHEVVEEMKKIAKERVGVMTPASVVFAHCAFWMKVFNDGMGDDPRSLMTLAWLVKNAPVGVVIPPDASEMN